MLLAGVVAAPAAAATGPLVTASDLVKGRDSLTLTLAGVTEAVAVTTTDAAGAVAQWSLAAPEALAPSTVGLDLTAPDVGEPPLNGPVALAVSAADTVLLESIFLLDATPPTPTLHGRGRTETVSLRWDAVRANGPVTYRLARDAGKGWTTVADGLETTSFEDRGVAGDWYRYRLTAVVLGAGGGQNLSQPDDAVVRVASAAPAPAASPKPKPAPAPTPQRVQRPRKVAATGSIRGPVDPRQERRDRAVARAAVRAHPEQKALVPHMGGLGLRWDGSAKAPAVAAPRSTTPPVSQLSSPDPALPVLIPPAGMLAVDAGRAVRTEPVAVAAGLLLLTTLGLATGLARGRLLLRGRPVAVTVETAEQ